MWQNQAIETLSITKITKIKHINSLISAKIFAKIKQIQILTHTAALYFNTLHV